MRKSTTLSLGLIAVMVAACSTGGGGASPAASATPVTTPAPSTAAVPSAAPSVAPSPTPNACATASLKVVTPGKFTIGTDNPAFPPYFNAPSGAPTKPWKIGDPTTGDGFESAVGYAIADRLGFAKADVAWIVVPFLNSFAPGPKTFDIDLNQVNYKAERTKTADLTKGYYYGNQSLVALKTNPIAKATTIAAMKDYVWGAQVGTTSLDAIKTVIAPTKAPLIYDTNDLAVKALGNRTIDAIMVDLPTADYITNVQIENGRATIVGQFQAGTPEYFSAVLAKGSPLTDCVNTAIASLTDDGTLKTLTSKYLPFQDTVPVVQP